jgi:hypothetical protein
MRAVSDADGQIEVLMNGHAALGERDAKLGRAYLKDLVLERNGIVLVDGSFGFKREDKVEIDVWRNWDESRALLLGRLGETFVELGDVMIFEKAVGLHFCFDAVESEFVGKPALKRFVHPFASTSRLWRVGWDHTDSKFA